MNRHKALQPLSREHHHGLLLCWKIRTGLSKGISISRIKNYTDWFYMNYLVPHFYAEEKFIFPVLGDGHKMIKKVTAEHSTLNRLFNDEVNFEKSIHRLEEELKSHIRFEERILFPKIQEAATTDQLKRISELHDEKIFIENPKDEFWK